MLLHHSLIFLIFVNVLVENFIIIEKFGGGGFNRSISIAENADQLRGAPNNWKTPRNETRGLG